MANDVNTELVEAIKSYNMDRIRAALANQPDLSIPVDQYGELPPFGLMAKGVEFLKEILDQGLDVNALSYAGDKGWTLLMGAVYLGRLDCVKLLLERGADIRRKDAHGHSVIDHLSLTNKYSPWAEIVTLLIDAGMDVNGHCHVSPLMYCDDRNAPAAKLLIKQGINVNFRNDSGTALHYVVERKAKKMIELLLTSGADPNIITNENHQYPGLTALELARELNTTALLF
jgi:ankyrin repeat protein